MLAILKGNAMFFLSPRLQKEAQDLNNFVGISRWANIRGGEGGLVRWRKETTNLQRAFKCKNLIVRLKM